MKRTPSIFRRSASRNRRFVRTEWADIRRLIRHCPPAEDSQRRLSRAVQELMADEITRTADEWVKSFPPLSP